MSKSADSNETLMRILPDIKKEFDILNSTSFQSYEEKLNKATEKAISALEGIIDDGSLALDPEQLVKAVDTLTKAKMNIVDNKRRLLETMLKGEVMYKALEPPKDEKNSNVLLDYLKANNLNQSYGESKDSIFAQIEENNSKEENKEE